MYFFSISEKTSYFDLSLLPGFIFASSSFFISSICSIESWVPARFEKSMVNSPRFGGLLTSFSKYFSLSFSSLIIFNVASMCGTGTKSKLDNFLEIYSLHLLTFQTPKFSANHINICFWDYIAKVVMLKVEGLLLL